MFRVGLVVAGLLIAALGVLIPGPVYAPTPDASSLSELAARQPVLSKDAIAAVVTPVLQAAASNGLGGHVAVAVAPLTGPVAFSAGTTDVMTPASVTKLLTTTAALAVLGPRTTFATTVLRSGSTVILKGGGDPELNASDLDALASDAATALRAAGVTKVTAAYDDSLWGDPWAAAWPADYRYDTYRISPLGLARPSDGSLIVPGDPAPQALAIFAKALVSHGVAVTRAGDVTAPADSVQVATHASPTVATIVKRTLMISDNFAAETLARQVALRTGAQPTFAGAAQAVLAELTKLRLDVTGVHLDDDSGLSPADRIPPSLLVTILQRAARTGGLLSTIAAGLPVAATSGTLKTRFTTPGDPSAGVLAAKTGSLKHVDTMAGYTTDADGHRLVLVEMTDRAMNDDLARKQLDAMASALTACHCG